LTLSLNLAADWAEAGTDIIASNAPSSLETDVIRMTGLPNPFVILGLGAHLLSMEGQKLSRAVVTRPEAARVFGNPMLRRLLLWFSREPRSVGEASLAIGIDIRRVHYQVRRLEALGLLRAVGSRSRAGRPVRLYRAVARSFFVPFDAAPAGFGDALTVELRETLAMELARGGGGMLFRASLAGSVRGRIVLDDRRRGGATEMWRVLRLDPSQADALKLELRALLNRYQREPGGAAVRNYLIHAALAPRQSKGGLTDNP